MVEEKRNLSFLKTGLSAILYLLNPPQIRTEGSLGWCPGVRLAPGCRQRSQQGQRGVGRSRCQWSLGVAVTVRQQLRPFVSAGLLWFNVQRGPDATEKLYFWSVLEVG